MLTQNTAQIVKPGIRGHGIILALSFLLLVSLVVGSFIATSLLTKGFISVGLLLILLMLSVPVGVAMALAGLLTLFSIGGAATMDHVMATEPHSIVASWSLSVLPMFVFMGLLLWRSGATGKMYEAARVWLGWMPGGLAVTTNAVGGALGAASGSTLGVTYAVGRIGIPAMLRAGYPKQITLASVVMAGSGGQLIPPSIALVVFASIASVPVGAALMAGVVPGVLLVVLYAVILVIVATVVAKGGRTKVAPAAATQRERWRSLLSVWPVPTIIAIVLGGMFVGLFTATEAGAFGAGAALLLCAWMRRGEATKVISGTAIETLAATGSIFLLLVGGSIFARALALSGVTQALTDTVIEAGIGRVAFLLGLVVLYLILGMFLDPMAMMLLTVPPLLPLLEPLGISPIWFGAFVILMAEISFVTPPVGILLYVVHRIAQDPRVSLGHSISIRDVFLSAMWGVLPTAFLVVGLMIAFPDLALWLPAQLGD